MQNSIIVRALIVTTGLMILGAQNLAAQQSGTAFSALPPIGNMAPEAMAALAKVRVHDLTLGMTIGEAIADLEAQGYSYDVQKNQQRGRNTKTVTYTFLKGKVLSTRQDRQRIQLHVFMDQPDDPNSPDAHSADWPVISIAYVLQDRDNTAKMNQQTGYNWTGSAESAMADKARTIVCPALAAAGHACRETDTGFSTDFIQDGTKGGGLASFSGQKNGTYKVVLQSQLPY